MVSVRIYNSVRIGNEIFADENQISEEPFINIVMWCENVMLDLTAESSAP